MGKNKKAKKLGRPLGSGKPANKVRKLFATRLDDDERGVIERAAGKLDKSASEFVREVSVDAANKVICSKTG